MRAPGRTHETALAALVLATSLTGACSTPLQEGGTASPGAGSTAQLADGVSGQVAGLEWTAPATWQAVDPGPMRAASFRVPAPDGGDGGDADMSVSHFPGGGGGENANIQRWIGQFSAPDGGPATDVKRGHKGIGGFTVTTLEVAGAYRGGPSSTGGPREAYRLLAAIVPAPEGPVFFKLTGPVTTMAAAADGFHAMLGSIRTAPTD